jgi:RimJ/RimL family protein N-acetyltransferase
MAYYKKMVGEKVYLSPISTEEIDTYMRWINDADVTLFMPSLRTQSISTVKERELVDKMAKNELKFNIIDLETDKIIGNCGFFSENLLHRKAEVGIMIGDKDYWSQGYGADALRLLLDFGFHHRNYHNICLHAVSANHRAIKCYEKVGFKRQGVYREDIIYGDKKYDSIYMDILSTEWRKFDDNQG